MVDSRPAGRLGELYDRVARYYPVNPSATIEAMANEAKANGSIDDNVYYALKHRIPFPGYERKPLKAIKNELGIRTHGWILEREGFFHLIPYLEALPVVEGAKPSRRPYYGRRDINGNLPLDSL